MKNTSTGISTKRGVNTNDGVNKKVIINSVIAIACLALTYLVNWLFIIPAVYIVWVNQKELMASRPQVKEKK